MKPKARKQALPNQIAQMVAGKTRILFWLSATVLVFAVIHIFQFDCYFGVLSRSCVEKKLVKCIRQGDPECILSTATHAVILLDEPELEFGDTYLTPIAEAAVQTNDQAWLVVELLRPHLSSNRRAKALLVQLARQSVLLRNLESANLIYDELSRHRLEWPDGRRLLKAIAVNRDQKQLLWLRSKYTALKLAVDRELDLAKGNYEAVTRKIPQSFNPKIRTILGSQYYFPFSMASSESIKHLYPVKEYHHIISENFGPIYSDCVPGKYPLDAVIKFNSDAGFIYEVLEGASKKGLSNVTDEILLKVKNEELHLALKLLEIQSNKLKFEGDQLKALFDATRSLDDLVHKYQSALDSSPTYIPYSEQLLLKSEISEILLTMELNSMKSGYREKKLATASQFMTALGTMWAHQGETELGFYLFAAAFDMLAKELTLIPEKKLYPSMFEDINESNLRNVRSVFLPLTYRAARSGYHNLAYSYIKHLPAQEIPLKYAAVTCATYGLAETGNAIQVLKLLQGLADSSLDLLAPFPGEISNKDYKEFIESCVDNTVYGKTCALLLSIRAGLEFSDDMPEIEESLRNKKDELKSLLFSLEEHRQIFANEVFSIAFGSFYHQKFDRGKWDNISKAASTMLGNEVMPLVQGYKYLSLGEMIDFNPEDVGSFWKPVASELDALVSSAQAVAEGNALGALAAHSSNDHTSRDTDKILQLVDSVIDAGDEALVVDILLNNNKIEHDSHGGISTLGVIQKPAVIFGTLDRLLKKGFVSIARDLLERTSNYSGGEAQRMYLFGKHLAKKCDLAELAEFTKSGVPNYYSALSFTIMMSIEVVPILQHSCITTDY